MYTKLIFLTFLSQNIASESNLTELPFTSFKDERAHLKFKHIQKMCTERLFHEVCKSNDSIVCTVRYINRRMEYRSFENACYLFFNNMCDNPTEEFNIIEGGTCEEFLSSRRHIRLSRKAAGKNKPAATKPKNQATQAKKAATQAKNAATAAKKAATTAKKAAAPAKNVATTAKKAAAPAKNVATTAKKTAAPAKNVATTAKKTAAPAKNVATTAKKAAAPAKNVATTAKKTATQAKNAATTAKKAAAPAKNVATTAKKAAAPAKNVATTAKKTATTAKPAATQAKNAATQAKTSATAAKPTVTEAKNTNTQAHTTTRPPNVATTIKANFVPTPYYAFKKTTQTVYVFSSLYSYPYAFDDHVCPSTCPNVYSPVCLAANRGAGPKFLKFFQFVNHCKGDMYYCKNPQEFLPPPHESMEDIDISPLSWTYCSAYKYVRFARFSEEVSSMGHYGWLAGNDRYSRIVPHQERRPGYGK